MREAEEPPVGRDDRQIATAYANPGTDVQRAFRRLHARRESFPDVRPLSKLAAQDPQHGATQAEAGQAARLDGVPVGLQDRRMLLDQREDDLLLRCTNIDAFEPCKEDARPFVKDAYFDCLGLIGRERMRTSGWFRGTAWSRAAAARIAPFGGASST